MVRQMTYSLKLNELQNGLTYCLINSAGIKSQLVTWAKVWQKQNLTRFNEKLQQRTSDEQLHLFTDTFKC